VRWDSDHVVTFNEDPQAIAQEIVRCKRSSASTSAWIISTPASTGLPPGRSGRNTLRALLNALPNRVTCFCLEAEGDFSQRLATLEELKAMPASGVGILLMSKNVPVGVAFMDEIKDYERICAE
jgi:L-rhamnose isomerase